MLKMLLKFGFIGLTGVGINMAVYLAALYVGCHYILAALLAFLVAVTSNFFWNVRWTFKGRATGTSIRRKYITFVTISGQYGIRFNPPAPALHSLGYGPTNSPVGIRRCCEYSELFA